VSSPRNGSRRYCIPRGRIALAITCDDMPQTMWSPDNPAYLLMSRVSEIVIDGLGK